MFKNQNIAQYLLNRKYWMFHFLFVAIVCIGGLYYLGYSTYQAAPPLTDFVDSNGKQFISKQDIEIGQQVFLQRGLMTYGTFWGDGAERGPDFTADSIHKMTLAMRGFYNSKSEFAANNSDDEIAIKIRNDFRVNKYDVNENKIIVLT